MEWNVHNRNCYKHPPHQYVVDGHCVTKYPRLEVVHKKIPTYDNITEHKNKNIRVNLPVVEVDVEDVEGVSVGIRSEINLKLCRCDQTHVIFFLYQVLYSLSRFPVTLNNVF